VNSHRDNWEAFQGKKYACLFLSLNGLPTYLLNDLIVCTEKSFFEGSEGLSDPEGAGESYDSHGKASGLAGLKAYNLQM